MFRVDAAEKIEAHRFLMILEHYIWVCYCFLLCFTGAFYTMICIFGVLAEG